MARFIECMGPDDCWLWTGRISHRGYGHFVISKTKGKSRTIAAHRMVWILAHGEVPKDVLICHTCDVRACCNLKHLFKGTALDNTRDMIAKGRQKLPPSPKGETNQNAKFSDALLQKAIAEAKSLYRKDAAVARKYGISPAYMSQLKHGLTTRQGTPRNARRRQN